MNRNTPLRPSSLSSSKKGRRGKGKRRISYAGFWAAVVAAGEGRCAICGAEPRPLLLDAHHYIPKQRLADDAAKVDPRNGVCLDRVCHEQVTNGRIDCPRPPDLDAFLEDHGLLPSGRPDPKRKEAA